MSLANTYLKSAAIIAAMMTSTSAFAQWSGTWDVGGDNARLSQYGDYVSGQIGSRGTVRGILSPDRKIMRGVFSESGRKYTVQFTLIEPDKFRGRVVNIRGGYPASANDITWTGTAKQKRQTSRAKPSFRQSFLGEQSGRVTSWINRVSGMRVPVAQAAGSNAVTAATSQPQPAADPGIQGTWVVTLQGTSYGRAFGDRKQAFSFSAPDRNGVVTGHSLGRNNLIFIGRKQDNSRAVRGVWMERKARDRALNPSGRWGLMELRLGGEPAKSLDARFSIGYRKPNVAWTKNRPGLPGVRAIGNRATNEGNQTPSVRLAQNAWDKLLSGKSPYPGIHGIWPTREINSAIQVWIAGKKKSSNFGGNQSVDPCAAKCMGREPTEIIVKALGFYGWESWEQRLEFAGQADAGIILKTDGQSRYALPRRVKRVFERPRSNPVKIGEIPKPGFVKPPSYILSYQQICDIAANVKSYGSASFPLTQSVWSDPLTEIQGIYGGRIVELGIRGRNQNILDPVSASFLDFKSEWSEKLELQSVQQALADGRAVITTPCLNASLRFRKKGRGTGYASIGSQIGIR